MIVMKFGGSSLESASAIEQVASIVKAHLKQRPTIVVSAMGKTTDGLVEAADHAARGSRTSPGGKWASFAPFTFRKPSGFFEATRSVSSIRASCRNFAN